jgi:hypothetical protein
MTSKLTVARDPIDYHDAEEARRQSSEGAGPKAVA